MKVNGIMRYCFGLIRIFTLCLCFRQFYFGFEARGSSWEGLEDAWGVFGRNLGILEAPLGKAQKQIIKHDVL